MKVNRKRVKLIERMAYIYRHRKIVGAQVRHDLQASKAKHPSRARSSDRENASLE
jgi:hypothetical protein